mgnify:CR=1 FL=1
MRPYYEGWYMKQQQGGDILAVIPGRAQDEAFIQVVTADGAHYLPFPLEDFRQTGTRSMRVGRSLFSPIGMMLDVQAPDLELVGRLRYRELTPLRSDIMGAVRLPAPGDEAHGVQHAPPRGRRGGA